MNFWERIKYFFIRVGSVLKKVLGTILSTAGRKIFDELLEFAIEICADLDYEDISNSEKRKKAFNEIKEKATSRGVELKSCFINSILELAVSYLRSLGNDDE